MLREPKAGIRVGSRPRLSAATWPKQTAAVPLEAGICEVAPMRWLARLLARLALCCTPASGCSWLTMMSSLAHTFSLRPAVSTLILSGMLACGLAHAADKPNSGQRKAAEEFLAAVASGDPQSVAYAIHPAELDALRARLLAQMRDEAKRNDNTIRARLFGPGLPLVDLERMTSPGFYTALSRRLSLGGR